MHGNMAHTTFMRTGPVRALHGPPQQVLGLPFSRDITIDVDDTKAPLLPSPSAAIHLAGITTLFFFFCFASHHRNARE